MRLQKENLATVKVKHSNHQNSLIRTYRIDSSNLCPHLTSVSKRSVFMKPFSMQHISKSHYNVNLSIKISIFHSNLDVMKHTFISRISPAKPKNCFALRPLSPNNDDYPNCVTNKCLFFKNTTISFR